MGAGVYSYILVYFYVSQACLAGKFLDQTSLLYFGISMRAAWHSHTPTLPHPTHHSIIKHNQPTQADITHPTPNPPPIYPPNPPPYLPTQPTQLTRLTQPWSDRSNTSLRHNGGRTCPPPIRQVPLTITINKKVI